MAYKAIKMALLQEEDQCAEERKYVLSVQIKSMITLTIKM
mgnify:CR=1 FL=1